MTEKRYQALMASAVLLATLIVFWPAMNNGFVNWDDEGMLLDNPYYRGLGWRQISWMFTTFHYGHYQPLSWLSLAIDYAFWGMNPAGYHFTSIFLHSINAVLAYFLILELIRWGKYGKTIRWAAGFSALFFSIHPLRVESVCWVTERRDVLSGAFLLSSLICYLQACKNSAYPLSPHLHPPRLSGRQVPQGERSKMGKFWFWSSVSIFLLSLLSKAVGITFPLILIALDIYPLKRLPGGSDRRTQSAFLSICKEKIPFVILSTVFSITAFFAQRHAGAVVPLVYHSLGARLAQTAIGMGFYLGKTLIPLGLSPLYAPPNGLNREILFLLCAAFVLLMTAWAASVWRRQPAIMIAWTCYLLLLLPTSGLSQSGEQYMADRYTYISCLSWAALLGAGMARHGRGSPAAYARRYLVALFLTSAASAGGMLAFLTRRQIRIWHDSVTLWNHALTVSPSAPAHYNLGNALMRLGEWGDAMTHYERALEMNPYDISARNNLAGTYAKKGELGRAAEEFSIALALDSQNPELHYNLGVVLASQGNLIEAVKQYRETLQLNPNHAKAREKLDILSKTAPQATSPLVGEGQGEGILRRSSHPSSPSPTRGEDH